MEAEKRVTFSQAAKAVVEDPPQNRSIEDIEKAGRFSYIIKMWMASGLSE